MSKTQFVAVLIRLMGFYILLSAIAILPSAVQSLFSGGALVPESGWWSLTISLMWFTAALCMLAFPGIVAGNVLARHGDEPLKFAWTRNDFETVGFSLLGLYFLGSSIRDGSYWFTIWFINYRQSIDSNSVPLGYLPLDIAGIVSMLVSAAIGLWLLLGAKGLRRLLDWARRGGTAPG